jgi:hypothetical protein
MIKLFWLFIVVVVITLVRKYLRGDREGFWYAVLVGLIAGLFCDGVLGYGLRLYYYGHIPYWTWDYFTLILPAWMMFGVVTWEVYYILSGKWWVKILMVTVLSVAFNEGIAYFRDSWEYLAPFWMICVGWVGLVAGIIGTVKILQKRVDKLARVSVE